MDISIIRTWTEMLQRLLLVFLYFTQSAADPNTFVLVSENHFSMEYKELLDKNRTQCTESETENSENFKIICKYQEKDVYVKPKCFCAGITDQMDLKCDKSQSILCCDENVACFNEGHLIKESNCTSTHEPSFKCTCPTAPNGVGHYHGDRCQYISVIRECKSQSTVNESYKNCDDMKNDDSRCIYSVQDTPYECGPVLRNTDGMNCTKCEKRHMNYVSVTDNPKQTPTSDRKSCENTVHPAVLIVLGVIAVIIIFIIVYVFKRREKMLRLHADSRHTMAEFYPQNKDPETEEDDEMDTFMLQQEARPFLQRSLSVPVSGSRSSRDSL